MKTKKKRLKPETMAEGTKMWEETFIEVLKMLAIAKAREQDKYNEIMMIMIYLLASFFCGYIVGVLN